MAWETGTSVSYGLKNAEERGTLFIGPGQILILIVVPIVTIALIVFLRRSRLGRATRGAAENGEAAALAGVPINRVSLAMWAIAGLLAGIAAILVGPTRPIKASKGCWLGQATPTTPR